MRIAEDRNPTASRVGSYEILHRFAIGGMAELFLARSVGPERFEKLVVLKKILPRLASNERFVQLFLDEARLAASLEHPNIMHVFDLGRVDGTYFFAMEYVHGRDLRSVLHRAVNLQTPLPIQHAVHIARDVAAALHYAHERCGPDGSLVGIVHRDVSPSNVLIAFEGTTKLLDFGVAKAATSTVKTRTGALKGKVAYMSPEQAKGATVDRRSDIFSVGIVLWEMVTSRRLYKGPNDLATIQLIINQPPPAPSSLRAGCPHELDRIILRALAQDPNARYQTASELQSDLEDLAREQKLNLSSIALGNHLGVLFSAEIKAWREARATGVSLAQHVIETSVVDPEVTPSGEFANDAVEEAVWNDSEKTDRNAPPPPVAPKRRGNNDEDRSFVRLSSGRTPPPEDHPVVPEPSIVIEDSLVKPLPEPPALTFAGPEPARAITEAGWQTAPTVASRPTAPPGRGKWIAFGAAALAIAAGIVIVKSAGSSAPAAADIAPVNPSVETESRTIELTPSLPPPVVTPPPPRADLPVPEPVDEEPAKPVAAKPVEAKPVEAKPEAMTIEAKPVEPAHLTVTHKPLPPPPIKRALVKPHPDHPPAKPTAAKFDPDAALPPM